MADDEPAPAPSMTREESHAEAELQMRDISQRFGTLPQDKDELLELLVDAEAWLLRLDQIKTRSTPDILSTTKGVLISRDLLDHPDPDVKLAVTSCLTEVIRLTAPDAPYGDDTMKEVFQRIVDTFADLGDVDSPFYKRRFSVLDSVAGVKCCILMLDLGLDHLIVDMFHHFFKASSMNDSGNVIKRIEAISSVVIEESDDIHSELASCVLQNLTKEAEVTLPASFALAERLVGLCKDKFKPVFAELLRGKPYDNYCNVVTFMCQDASNAVAADNLDASGMSMGGEGKISERSVSRESPQETSSLQQDVNCTGQNDTRPGMSPPIAISNGGPLGDSNKSPDDPPSSEQNPGLSSGDQAKTKKLISGDNEMSEPVTSDETEKPSDVNSQKSQKLDSSTIFEMTEHSKVVKDKESLVAAEELSPETDHGDDKQLTKTSKKAADTTPSAIKKQGRPPAAKSQGKKPTRTKQSGLKSGKVDPLSDSERRVTRQQAKRDVKSSSTKAERESMKRRQKSTLKLHKEDVVSDKDADEDTNLKKMVLATETDKTRGQQEDGGVSKRKRLQEAKEAPLSKKNKMLDENLVGSRIKVWWPDDKMFYNGVVKSFNASSETHKVAYDDGDVEMLQLEKERWDFTDEEQDSDSDAVSNIPRGRRGKSSSSLQMGGGNPGTPESDGGNPPKKKGRPKGVRSSNNKSNAASSAKLKGKVGEKDTLEISVPGRRITRSIGKDKDDYVKASNNDEAVSTGNSEESNDKAGSEDNTSNDEVKSFEAVDGSKTNAHSTKRKIKEKENESEEEVKEEEKVPAKASTAKKRGRKGHK